MLDLTENAASEFKKALEGQNALDSGIRIFMAGGG